MHISSVALNYKVSRSIVKLLERGFNLTLFFVIVKPFYYIQKVYLRKIFPFASW